MDDGLPGGDDWLDVTEIFKNAADEMDPEDVLLVDGFTLFDAMTAIEIGDSRMDTGVILPAQLDRPAYDPQAPLLPSELCWLLDRSFAAEMQWHKGYTLSQTVFTFLPIHFLDDLHPDTAPLTLVRDPERPRPLVVVVLRAAVTALMKCVDLSWRELSMGRVYDTEDWQSEKAEVSLDESTPVGTALARLEFAIAWLTNSAPSNLPWREEILARLRLRQTLLQLFRVAPTRDPSTLRAILTRARSCLNDVLISPPPPEPAPDSPASLAFDPYIARRLSATIPLQPLTLLPQADAWSTIDALLTGYEDLHALLHEPSLFTWRLIGDLQHTQPSRRPTRPGYIRSLTQSSFFDGYHVLGQTASSSLIDKFFLETLGTSFPYPLLPVQHPPSPARRTLSHIQSLMVKTLSKDVQSGWFNPPRRRRHLSNKLFEWTYLYFTVCDFIKLVHETPLDPPLDHRQLELLEAMPLAIACWRAGSIREIVLAGFGLELYAPAERAGAYWLLREACEAELNVRERMEELLAPDSLAKRISVARRPVLLAMTSIAHALFLMTLPTFLVADPVQSSLTYHKRHKLFLREEYSRLPSRSTWPEELVQPHWGQFINACEDALRDTGHDEEQESAQVDIGQEQIAADDERAGDRSAGCEGDGGSGEEALFEAAPDAEAVDEVGPMIEDMEPEGDREGDEGVNDTEQECQEEGPIELEEDVEEESGAETSHRKHGRKRRVWGTAKEELQQAADLLAQVDIAAMPFAALQSQPPDSPSDSPPPPPSAFSLPWTTDLTQLYASLRIAALALSEIAPSSTEEVAAFNATSLDWRNESLVGGWIPGVRTE